ncbi:hypothetical protein [Leifsonia sp. NPDC077715]|uniref:hypothetical protein n=1 Tax=Leifsonia sp. NPDC077715 TaxID=3155539 RepID=UPI003444B2ED
MTLDPGTPVALQAHASVTLADFVNVDGDGKTNVIGGGLRALPLDSRGYSAPFGVLASIALPEEPDHSVIVELVLTGPHGETVRLADETGRSTEIRVTQQATFTSSPHHVVLRAHAFPATHVIAVSFPGGLRFLPGCDYRWQVELDGLPILGYAFCSLA